MYRQFLQNSMFCKNISWSRCRVFLQEVHARRFANSLGSSPVNGNGDDRERLSTLSHGEGMALAQGEMTGSSNVIEYQRRTTLPRSRTLDRNAEDLYKRYLMLPDQPENPHLIRVAIIGAPNAGKSSLVNSLMGWKVNAVSKKVHTTRVNTNTVVTVDNTQIIFVDTPGVLTRTERKRHHCDGRMLTDPERSLEEADIVGVIVDAADQWTRTKLHPEIVKVLNLHRNIKSFLILNKIDQLRTKSILKQQRILLGVTSQLADGKIGGKEFGRKVTERKKEKEMEDRSSLFDRLEKKYGELEAKKRVKSVSQSDGSKGLEGTEPLEENETEVGKDVENKTVGRLYNNNEYSSESTAGQDENQTVNDRTFGSNNNSVGRKCKSVKSDEVKQADRAAVADRIFQKLNVSSSKKSKEAFRIDESCKSENEEVDQNIEDCKSKCHDEFMSGSGTVVKEVKIKDSKVTFLKENTGKEESDQVNKEQDIATDIDTVLKDDRGSKVLMQARGMKITEKSYQSEFLESIQSKSPLLEFSSHSQNSLQKEESTEDTDWTEKVSLMKEAVKLKGAWDNFDEVFLTSCVDGTGVDALREYLVKNATPRDWVYHSSVITDQHPYDIAKMCITQSLLDHIDSYLPYVIEPEILYWDVDEHNRLNISVELKMANSYEMGQMLGGGSDRIKAISGSARQALMDAFQCEVRFKMSIVRKKKRS